MPAGAERRGRKPGRRRWNQLLDPYARGHKASCSGDAGMGAEEQAPEPRFNIDPGLAGDRPYMPLSYGQTVLEIQSLQKTSAGRRGILVSI